MQVINIDKRTIYQQKEMVSQLFKTLTTDDDLAWPYGYLLAMRFRDELEVGSKGGHGRILYTIINFKADENTKFQFTESIGFNGTDESKNEP